MEPASDARRYLVVGRNAVVEELDRMEIRERIRAREIESSTLVAAAGTDDWRVASEYPELRRYLQLAGDAAPAARRAAPAEDSYVATVTPFRLIVYMTLAGLAGAILMGFMAPLCMMIGVLARFLLTTAALGAVLGLGINTALREPDSRVINLSAGGFAAGGAIAWLFSGSGMEFTALHLAIIGLAGGASLAYALRLRLLHAASVAIAAAVLFPLAVMLNPIRPGSNFSMTVPMWATPFLYLVVMVIPAIPFALFGGFVGTVIAFAPGARTHVA